jgi:glutamine amidotransferase|tara:strand:- start:2646 stop:3236 length:591 start_codon:yes stop_codon:yes gene_type:complete
MIVIIDYGLGNVKSISNMLNKIDVENMITSDVDVINSADKYILPGVGSFDEAMRRINEADWLKALEFNVIKLRKPILGICLGMQLLSIGSEEGKLRGLSWVDVTFNRFDRDMLTPHMGWNIVKSVNSELFKKLDMARFYFVHSFYLAAENSCSIATSNYNKEFSCAMNYENIYGVQFHPEKSHRFGKQLLKNFSEL